MSTRSTQVVSTRPSMKSAARKTRRCMGMVVLTPSIDQFLECPAHPGEGLEPVRGMDDELAQERVVVGRNRVSGLHVRVPSHAGTAGNSDRGDPAGRRAEVVVRILGVDAAFQGMAPGDDVLLAKRERLTGGDPDLLADQVDAGDHLGDGVLDLDPGVDLDEVELILLIDQELTGTGIDVTDSPGQADRGLADLGTDRKREGGGGASSTSFWCRRWSEQSRSQQCTTLPWESARIWTSTWRGRSMNFSR